MHVARTHARVRKLASRQSVSTRVRALRAAPDYRACAVTHIVHVLLYTAHLTKRALATSEVKFACELSRLHDEAFKCRGIRCSSQADRLLHSEPESERVHVSTTHEVHFTRDSLSPCSRFFRHIPGVNLFSNECALILMRYEKSMLHVLLLTFHNFKCI